MVGGTANMSRLALVRNRHLGAYVLEYQIGCYSYTNLHPEQRESPGKFISAPQFLLLVRTCVSSICGHTSSISLVLISPKIPPLS